MIRLADLIEKNRIWAEKSVLDDPAFFQRLVQQQRPRFLWIGCADSRVPATQIVDMQPGEMFVHRNIANVVAHTDLNFLSVLQYAVQILEVEHIIVCGHYGCGGVRAALMNQPMGLIDNWLRYIREVHQRHKVELAGLTEEARLDRLCELNVIAQVSNVTHTSLVQEVWRSGRRLVVHGWIYRLTDGLIHDLGVSIESSEKISDAFRLGS